MVISVIAMTYMAFAVYMLFKNENTFRNRTIINNAIFTFKMYCLKEDYKAQYDVDYEDMESYEKTMFRLWDWGYKRILPPDKFEILERFIGQEVPMTFTGTFEEEE